MPGPGLHRRILAGLPEPVVDVGRRHPVVAGRPEPLDEQLHRLAHDRTRPLIASGDREAVLRRLADEREPLYAALADLCFDTDGLGPAEACARLGHLLDGRWRRGAAA